MGILQLNVNGSAGLLISDTGNHLIRFYDILGGDVVRIAGIPGAQTVDPFLPLHAAPRQYPRSSTATQHPIPEPAAPAAQTRAAAADAPGWRDGPALSAAFNRPTGLAVATANGSAVPPAARATVTL